MSLLKGKLVLVIGEPHPTLVALVHYLETQHVTVRSALCVPATLEEVIKQKIDFVLINDLVGDASCAQFLQQLNHANLSRTLPVFALVAKNESAINRALMAGAADYFTPAESVDEIVIKIKRLFGEPDTTSGSNVFDVPEDVATVSVIGKRVFVFEDDPLLQGLLAAKLDTVSFIYEFASSGEGAISKLKTFRPHVIILDLMLPGKSGLEVLEDIKKDPTLVQTPIIVFSNRDSEEEKERVFALGVDRFFVKAMTDLSVLVETIEDLA